jgi:restriction system protein
MGLDPVPSTSIPAHVNFYWPMLQALKEMGGSGSIQEIDDRVIRLARLSESQQAVLHQGGPQSEVAYRLAWVRTHLRLVGAIENSGRGVWALTDYGRTLTESDMAGIPSKLRSPRSKRSIVVPKTLFDEFEQAVPKPSSDGKVFASTSTDEWRPKLLQILLELEPDRFERLCQRVLRESGFTRVDVTGRSGDGGIDGVGVLRIALLSFQVFFQCKRYKGSVGASAIRDLRGAMVGRTDKGLLITTGTFTTDAKREATRDGAPVLDLVDGDQLCTLLKDLKLGVSTRQVEEVLVHRDWFAEI